MASEQPEKPEQPQPGNPEDAGQSEPGQDPVDMQRTAPDGQDAAGPELVVVESKYKKYRPFVFAIIAILILHLGYSIHTQARCNRLMHRLADDQWEEAKAELVALGETAMPYVARGFAYHEDPVVRLRAGETLLETLRGFYEDAPKPPPEVIEAWEEWVEGTGADAFVLQVELLRRAETDDDPEVRALVPKMRPWLEWRTHIRTVGESEMMSLGLRDEDPECRRLALEMIRIVGFHNAVERDRYDRFLHMERLLAKLKEAPEDEQNVRAVVEEWSSPETVGEFGNPVLVGLIASDESEAVKKAAAKVLREMLAAAYRADDREEMVRLMGHRRLRLLLTILVRPEAEYIDIVELLTFSPNIPVWLVEGIRDRLAEAMQEDERAFQRALARWMDIYADLEEGQRALLRSAEVMALRPEGVEVED